MIDQLVYYIDNNGPTITRTLSTQGGGDLDIVPGMSFKLRSRKRDSDVVILDATMTPDLNEDTITYTPQEDDFQEEGVYRGWIVLITADGPQDTDEFDIIVLQHAPGEGTRTGVVWRAARAMVPTAWDSVRGIKHYGDIELQRQIELAKLRVLRTSYTIAQENALDPRVIDYIAKKVLVDGVLETAIDFWMNQVVSRSARGNSEEIETYPDRIRATEKQLERFEEDLAEQLAEIEVILGVPTGPAQQGPELDCNDELITPGLETFPRPYLTTTGTPPDEGWWR